MLHVSVLIVTKNRGPVLVNCLESLRGANGHNWEIVVADNASIDDTKKIANTFTQFLPIRYFYTDVAGYPKVYNFGITKCRGRTVVFLDDDCVVSKNWFESVFRAITMFPNEIIQGKTLSLPEGNIYAEIMGDHYQNWIKSHKISEKYLDCFDNKNLCVPRVLLTQSGLFNESLEMGSEDIELSTRLRASGVPIRYEEAIIAHHLERTTLAGFISQHRRIAGSESFLDVSGLTKEKIGVTNIRRIWLYIKSIISREFIYIKQARFIDAALLPFLYTLLVLIRLWGYGSVALKGKAVNVKRSTVYSI